MMTSQLKQLIRNMFLSPSLFNVRSLQTSMFNVKIVKHYVFVTQNRACGCMDMIKHFLQNSFSSVNSTSANADFLLFRPPLFFIGIVDGRSPVKKLR